jgi:hypothetical protein
VCYLKKINLIESYPQSYGTFITAITNKTIWLIQNCNANTVHIPIQVLSYLAKINLEVSKTVFSESILDTILHCFQIYNKDAMLADDLL